MIVRLDFPRRVRQGEAVPITVRVTNPAREAAALALTGHPVAFDLVVTRPDGTEVWSRLHGQVVPLSLQVGLLQPGASLEFTHRWDQLDNTGRPVASGVYQLCGILPTENGQLVSEHRELTIVG